ncbi:hypothetical protein PR003_g8306 [Phytophthora rubi]|uniref:PiggyBac transposable element-derived protein domain-containing protein n=1 Tax=Phytophthora rubi TaxID=129364 RepID=A0A6A4FBI9_9STRA|nr:hypothetical protein PR003_g8306 [Phytophthora rubi]
MLYGTSYRTALPVDDVELVEELDPAGAELSSSSSRLSCSASFSFGDELGRFDFPGYHVSFCEQGDKSMPDVNIVQAEEFTANGYTALDSGDEGEHGIDAFDCFEELWCDDAGAAGTADESFEDEELDDVFETPDDARVPRVHWGGDIDWPTPIDLVDYDDFVNDEVAFQAMRTDGWELDPDKFPEDTNYPGLYTGEFGPTSSVMAESESPLGLFFYFMPRPLWRKISKESSRYCDQSLSDRANCMFENQAAHNPRTLQQIYELEAKKPRIEPHELLRCIGLLIARMLVPQTRNFADHWATTSIGAVPTGTFGRYMARNRFAHIMQHLHFTNNAHPKSFIDRAWKVRSVLDTLQKRFAAGYKVPPVLAFDEAITPSRSRYNPTR